MNIKTERLEITRFTMDMAPAVHVNSLDEDNRAFNPDEVFETLEIAQDTVGFLMSVYENGDGPLVYPVLLTDGTNVGYVQAVPWTTAPGKLATTSARPTPARATPARR